MNSLSLREAFQWAAAAGLACRVMTGLAERHRSIRVALTTEACEDTDRSFLQMESAGRTADVPLLSAFSIVLDYGWTHDTSLATEARVDEAAFRFAIATLVPGLAAVRA